MQKALAAGQQADGGDGDCDGGEEDEGGMARVASLSRSDVHALLGEIMKARQDGCLHLIPVETLSTFIRALLKRVLAGQNKTLTDVDVRGLV